jgi:hypothetical protein
MSANLKRWLAPYAERVYRSIGREVGPGDGFPGAVQAHVLAARFCKLERVAGPGAVNRLALDLVTLALPIVERHSTLELEVSHSADGQAELLLFLLPDAERLGGLDGLPLARQRDRARDGLVNGPACQGEEPPESSAHAQPAKEAHQGPILGQRHGFKTRASARGSCQ